MYNPYYINELGLKYTSFLMLQTFKIQRVTFKKNIFDDSIVHTIVKISII
jgi:hypothetical protein